MEPKTSLDIRYLATYLVPIEPQLVLELCQVSIYPCDLGLVVKLFASTLIIKFSSLVVKLFASTLIMKFSSLEFTRMKFVRDKT